MKIDELLENKNYPSLPRVLYHGTQKKNVKSILDNGLSPTRTLSGQQGIYLTDDLYTAKNYGLMHGDDSVILKINPSALQLSEIGPDDYELDEFLDNPWSKVNDDLDQYHGWQDVPWWKSLEYVNQIVYYSSIPPQHIKVYE